MRHPPRGGQLGVVVAVTPVLPQPAAPLVSVFVCDDNAAERFLMAQLIKDRRDLYLCGTASSAFGAVRAIEAAQPDLVILDHLDHEGDVSVVVAAIREAVPGARVLIHSGLPESRIVGVSSASAYVHKAPGPEPLWQAIDDLLPGGRPAAGGGPPPPASSGGNRGSG